jgi:hypothetical protein
MQDNPYPQFSVKPPIRSLCTFRHPKPFPRPLIREPIVKNAKVRPPLGLIVYLTLSQ